MVAGYSIIINFTLENNTDAPKQSDSLEMQSLQINIDKIYIDQEINICTLIVNLN